jgi:hypothetical protein
MERRRWGRRRGLVVADERIRECATRVGGLGGGRHERERKEGSGFGLRRSIVPRDPSQWIVEEGRWMETLRTHHVLNGLLPLSLGVARFHWLLEIVSRGQLHFENFANDSRYVIDASEGPQHDAHCAAWHPHTNSLWSLRWVQSLQVARNFQPLLGAIKVTVCDPQLDPTIVSQRAS